MFRRTALLLATLLLGAAAGIPGAAFADDSGLRFTTP